MNENPTATLQPFSNEGITRAKMLDDIFASEVVDFDDVVGVGRLGSEGGREGDGSA